MESLMMARGGAWVKRPPASVYLDSGMDLPSLVFELDRRLAETASRFGILDAGSAFKVWFGGAKQLGTAFLFPGGEILSGGESLPSMFMLADEQVLHALISKMPESTPFLLAVMLCNPDELSGLCSEKKASDLRALLSGELVVAGSGAKSLRQANEMLAKVQERFEQNALEDLGELIAVDIRTEIARKNPGTDYHPVLNLGKEVFLPDREFVSMACRAMEERRVDRSLHRKLLPNVRKSLGRELGTASRIIH